MNNALTFNPLPNKYTALYFRIIENRCLHPVIGYVERHHIHPECLGGQNIHENMVALTAREHYICHLLLTKMLVGEPKTRMHYAFYSMRRKKKNMDRYEPNSHIYEIMRKRIDRTPSEETKRKMSIAQAARPPRSAETCALMSSSIKASYTPELRALRSEKFKNQVFSAATKEKMAAAKRGIKRTTEAKQKQQKTIRENGHYAAKTWILLSPQNEMFQTSRLKDFCEKRNISYSALRSRGPAKNTAPVSNGSAKGWLVWGCKPHSQLIDID